MAPPSLKSLARTDVYAAIELAAMNINHKPTSDGLDTLRTCGGCALF